MAEPRRPALSPTELVLADTYRAKFSDEGGKLVLEHMRARGFFYRTTTARPKRGQPIDALESSRNEGMRAFHLDTEKWIKLASVADRSRRPQTVATSITAESAPEES